MIDWFEFEPTGCMGENTARRKKIADVRSQCGVHPSHARLWPFWGSTTTVALLPLTEAARFLFLKQKEGREAGY
jgi:hypothetical protein